MKLLQFLANLTRDAGRKEAFSKDPALVMKQAGLSDVQQELILNLDAEGVGREIARECSDMLSGGRGPWPSSTVQITSIEPGKGGSGEVVKVKLEGLFFSPDAKCTLQRGQERIEGRVESVKGDLRSWMEVTFEIPRDATAGSWDIRVANDDEHDAVLPAAFETTATSG
jgi:hypothetical protein